MKRRIFNLVLMFMLFITSASAQSMTYTLIRPNCTSISAGVGYLFNGEVGDYNFKQNYVTYDFSLGQYFNNYVGMTIGVSVAESTTEGANTRLCNVGLDINTRLTNYYAYSPCDVVLNLGASYGHFKYTDYGTHSEGMDYFVPKVSLDIIFNLTSDKAYQFVIEPSYQYYVHTKDKYYYDDGSKVNADISAVGIKTKFRVNF